MSLEAYKSDHTHFHRISYYNQFVTRQWRLHASPPVTRTPNRSCFATADLVHPIVQKGSLIQSCLYGTAYNLCYNPTKSSEELTFSFHSFNLILPDRTRQALNCNLRMI